MLIPLDPEQRKALAGFWLPKLEAGIQAKGGLPARWEQNENLYKGTDTGGYSFIPELEAHHLPLTKPKIDRIIGTVFGAITSVKPYVQCIPQDDASSAVSEQIEDALQYLAVKGDFERMLWRWLYRTALTNIGLAQTLFVPGKGIEFRSHHQKGFVAFPAAFSDPARASLLGHNLDSTVREIRQRIADGEYYEDCVYQAYDPDSRSEGRHEDSNITSAAHGIQHKLDDICEVYEFTAYANLEDPNGEGDQKLYLVHADRNANEILKVNEYPYSETWYGDIRFDDDDDKFWPTTSVANSLQGVQVVYNALINTEIGGSMMAAAPPIVLIGSTMGGQKLTNYSPGQIIEMPGANNLTFQHVPVHYDRGGMPELISKMEEIADSQSRISRIGTGGQLRAGISKEETSGLLMMQSQAEDQYTAFVALSIVKIWKFMFELLKTHFYEIKAICGDAIPINDLEEIQDAHVTFEVNGKSSSNSPAMLLEKLSMAQQICQRANERAMATTGMPMWNLDELDIQSLQALDLPVSLDKLKVKQGGLDGLLAELGFDPALLQELLMGAPEGMPPPGGNQMDAGMLGEPEPIGAY